MSDCDIIGQMIIATSTKIEELTNYLSYISIELPAPDSLRVGGIDEIRRVVPAQPGVYAIFYIDVGKCFYVGSSVKSIRGRLLTHYGKDAKENYRGKLHKLLAPEKFPFWFFEIKRPSEISGQRFRCIVTALEAMCSASWEPEVESKKF